MALPTVAIVGRPNVGKSSLLNALAGARISIVDPRAGVTRDRVSVVMEHDERYFELVDTGGVGIIDDQQLESHVEAQIALALGRADAVLFVVDARDGLTPLDQRVAELLRRLAVPVLTVANKVDHVRHEPEAAEFARLGHGPALCVSALHGYGRAALLERLGGLPAIAAGEAPLDPVMKLAIVGKRNAGKSTLVNALAGEERVIVSETPGTTRDAIDVRFERQGKMFIAIDTAGVRKRRRMSDIDFYSHARALRSIRRADVVMLLIDATIPIGDVDSQLAAAIVEEQKPLVLAINKWDLAHGRAEAQDYNAYLTHKLPFVDYAPLVLLTAKTGKNVDAAVDTALSLHKQSRTRVSTGKLNAALESVLALRGPSAKHGTRPVKIYYATQAAVAPPTIVFFCNDPRLVTDNYRRFMENRLREILPFQETPLRLLFRARRAPGGGGQSRDRQRAML